MERVETIRVDLPDAEPQYKGGFMMFFISARYGERRHPWWNQVFAFLLALDRHPAGMSSGGEEMETALLVGEKRREFLELLRTAPESEVAGHRTLRSALRQLPQHDLDVPVRYFGPDSALPSDE